jgi:heat shock protein HslJ
MACPGAEMRIEDRFLASLGKAGRYTFLAGRLMLSGMDGETMRSVLLTRK